MVLHQLSETPDGASADEPHPPPCIPCVGLPYWFHQRVGSATFHASCTNPGKIPQAWGYLTPRIIVTVSPTLSLSKSGPHLVFFFSVLSWLYVWLQYQLFYFLSPQPPSLPPSLRQILVCAQLFPVPIASPELRGDGTSLGSCPVMSHVCRVASKGVKRDGP